MAANIDGKTKVFGIIGYPIKHTFSPYMHNLAFKALNINAAYVPFEVSPDRLKDAVCGLIALGVGGVNVTIPHKEAIMPFLDELSPEAKGIGAVNTVLLREGKSKGYNTDAGGFLSSLIEDTDVRPYNKSALVFGAGGAAKAIAYVLTREGIKSITFVDIVIQKAKELALKIRRDFPGCSARSIPFLKSRIDEEALNSDILVNASPVGMKKADPCIVSPSALHKDLAVYDLIYNPTETRLLKEAKKRGLKASNGIGMLLRQGALSFELFTGRRAPISVMRDALEKTMGNSVIFQRSASGGQR